MFWSVIGTALGIGAIVHGYRLYRYIQRRRVSNRILGLYRVPEPTEADE